MGNNYQLLVNKLDGFIRKYYKNQLIRGGIYFTATLLVSFLLVVTLEYFGRYNSAVRGVLFYSFLACTLYFLVRFVAIPLSKLYRIGKTLSYREASQIIGVHFPDVKDKLLNTLQLNEEAMKTQDASLLYAAINQKTEQLSPVPFAAAIDLKKNLRYARYVAIPVLLYVIIYFFAPGMISDGSERLIRYNQAFVPKAPFDFVVENELKADQFSDFDLSIKTQGQTLPDEVFVEVDGNLYKMQKDNKNHFSYTFRSVQKNTVFKLHADEFFSQDYTLTVAAKPLMINYLVHFDYPAYINKKDETVNNPGDLNIPAGTVVSWKFITRQTENLFLGFNNIAVKAEQKGTDEFSYSKKFFLSTPYFIKNSNSQYGATDSMQYNIQVVADAFPDISVDEKADSLNGKQLYFIGDIADDHGLTKLSFNYRFVKSETESKTKQGLQRKTLAIQKEELTQRFYYDFNLNDIGVAPADEVEYYFEVWDNDGVHGAKSSRSKTMVFKAPSIKELQQQSDASSNALKDAMEEAMKEAKDLQKEMKDLQRKMLDKKELSWEEKKKAEELLNRQKELSTKLEKLKKENQQHNRKEDEFKQQQENIIQKQQQLEQMFNKLMDEEMKKLIKEMEKLLQQQNKDAMKQELDKMQLNNKDVEKELDRMLEQFKQLEIEKKLEEASQQLDKLAEKQKQLAEKTEQQKNQPKENKQQQQEQIKQEQEKLQKDFNEVQQELKDIEKQNEQLEDKKDIENTDQEQQDINNEMNKGEENLEKNDNKKAAENQKKAAEKMKEMAAKMRKGMEEQEQKELELDAAALREILENTIQLSKDQEELMEKFKQINGYNPQYVELAQQQKKVKDNARIIEDSLLALSKRVIEIESFVNKEVSRLNDNLDKSVGAFGRRDFGDIRTRQQFAMMHANNLAVMLSEIMKQMQEQMQENNKPGKGSPKPGKKQKKLSMSQLKKRQEELNKQLKEGKNQCDNPGGGKPKDGNQSPGGNKPGSQQIARMAAEQQAIRQQLQQLMNSLDAKQKEQLGGTRQLEEMKKMMEQTEKELFNKKFTSEMIQRQQEILTRLLESEKAERKQEQEQRREAEQATDKPRPSPPDFEQYIKQKNKEKELLETIPADLQPYYRQKTKDYFNRIGND